MSESQDKSSKPAFTYAESGDAPRLKVPDDDSRTKAELRERIKELRCLYGISSLCERPDIELGVMLQRVVELLPPAWQHPDITCARVTVHEHVYQTPDFAPTPWRLAADIRVHQKIAGQVEVCLREERRNAAGSCFLPEETPLIKAVAERLGRVVERYQGRDALRRTHDELSKLVRIVNNSPAVAFIWRNAPGWPVEFVSENVRQFGYSPDELISGAIRFEEMVHPDDRARVAAEVAAHADADADDLHQEYGIVTRTGQTRWVDDRTWIRRGPDGRAVSFQGILLDITDRRHAETELRRHRERLDLAVYGSSDALWEWDIAGGDEAWWSPRFTEMLGYAAGELPQKMSTWRSLLHPDDVDRTLQAIQAHLHRQGEYEIEYRLKTKSGDYRWFRARGRAVWDDEGRAVRLAGALQDIDATRRAQQALRENTERLWLALEAANEGMCEWHFDNGELILDRVGLQMLGYNVGEAPQRADFWFSRIHPDDVAAVNSALAEHFDGRTRVYRSEYRVRTKRGSWCWLAVNGRVVEHGADGRPTRMIGIQRDVTAQRETEAALRHSVENYRGIFTATSDGLLVFDLDGRVVSANPRACEMHGYTLAELCGMSGLDLVHPDYHPLFREFMRGEFEAREFYAESIDLRKNGEPFHIEVRGSRFEYDGQPHMLASVADISERKRTEAELADYRELLERRVQERTTELEAAQVELLRRERLAALGQIIATVAHELRNPLGTVRTSVFSLKERLHDQEAAVDRILGRAERNIIRCDRIISELLDFTRMPALDRSPTHLDQWLLETLAELEWPAGVRQEFEGGADVCVSIDRDRFRRCVINVAQNAFSALADEGAIGDTLSIKTRQSGRHVEIEFRDQGPGIAPEQLQEIFEPLYSTRSFGVGLGLPIVQQIMEQHGGEIEITSTSGAGTSAILRLPLDSSPD